MTFGEDKDPALVDMIARWTIAMPYVLKAHVTEMKDLTVQLEVCSGPLPNRQYAAKIAN